MVAFQFARPDSQLSAVTTIPSATPTASPSGTATEADAGGPGPTVTVVSPTPTPTRTSSPSETPSEPHDSPPPDDPDPDPDPPPDDDAAGLEQEVVDIVNAERADEGCGPLHVDDRLVAASRAHSRDMRERDFFDHTNPDGESPWDRAGEQGYDSPGGENIARGQQDAEAVMQSWMDSPGHRANILNCDFAAIGVGVELGDGGPWWTQLFGYV